MQRLRQARVLARLVLAWFVLAMGVAVASPLVQPGPLQLVCSGMGAAKLVPAGDPTEAAPSLSLDCPLCASVAPPPLARSGSGKVEATARPVVRLPLDGQALRPAAPLPARGPPSPTSIA